MRARLRAFLDRALSRLVTGALQDGPRRTIHGIPVGVVRIEEHEASEEVLFERVTAALDLIAEHDPRRLGGMQSQLASILVWGGFAEAAGAYFPAQRVCMLSTEFVGRPDTPPVRIAMTLVHEAEHARIRQRGGKRTVSRYQEEWLCAGAAVAFARKVPGAEELADEYGRRLEQILEIYSPAATVERGRRGLRDLGIPEWGIRLIQWLFSARR